MSIIKKDLGKHQAITTAIFGTGDIKITRARDEGAKFESKILLFNQPAEVIGYTTGQWTGVNTDELPRPEMILEFTDSRSLNALIHSLCELQISLLGRQAETIELLDYASTDTSE